MKLDVDFKQIGFYDLSGEIILILMFFCR